MKMQQEWCGGGSILEKEDTISLIVVTSVALSAAGELLNSLKAGSFRTRNRGYALLYTSRVVYTLNHTINPTIVATILSRASTLLTLITAVCCCLTPCVVNLLLNQATEPQTQQQYLSDVSISSLQPVVYYSHVFVTTHGPIYIYVTDDVPPFLRIKLHVQGIVDIQTLYVMLACIPFGLAVPEAVLQVGIIPHDIMQQHWLFFPPSSAKSNFESSIYSRMQYIVFIYVCY